MPTLTSAGTMSASKEKIQWPSEKILWRHRCQNDELLGHGGI